LRGEAAFSSRHALRARHKIRGNIAFLGGPLNFLPELKRRFIETLSVKPAPDG
jgi:activator of 2-hydroxyglutaryl-CoA dehydratase